MTAPAETKVLAKLLDELDYYQLLEVPREATSSELKRAYYATSKRFHPDASRHLGPEARAAVDRIAKRITEAYSVLRDPRRRRAYDQRLQEGDGVRLQLAQAEKAAAHAATEERGGRTPQGKRFFATAESDLRRGDLASAARNLQMALTFEPANEHFKRQLADIKQKLG